MNYRYLNTEQKDKRLRHLHTELKSSRKSVKLLEARIKQMMNSESVPLDESTCADIKGILEVQHFSDEDNSFKAIFWREQMKALSIKVIHVISNITQIYKTCKGSSLLIEY